MGAWLPYFSGTPDKFKLEKLFATLSSRQNRRISTFVIAVGETTLSLNS
jgi:hypothetical protein